MDSCCYNRPFDDQMQDRVKIEAEVVLLILHRCEKGEWNLIGSEIEDLEIRQIFDEEKKQKVKSLYELVNKKIEITDPIKQRAKEIMKYGIKSKDSLHIASAESINVDVMLTTDDLLEKKSKNIGLAINVRNPVDWLMEVMKNE
jgi:predicted nucleic acid-binding protein